MIRVGVIGCGRILPAHLRGLAEIKARDLADFEITALDSHHIIGMDCLQSGRHLMVGKPLAISVEAAGRLVDAAADRRLMLATAEVVRYMVPIRGGQCIGLCVMVPSGDCRLS